MVVVKQRGRLAAILVRMAVGTVVFVATGDVVLGRPVDVVDDEEIQPSIVVVVEPRSTRPPLSRILDTGLARNIGKRAVAIVVVEDGARVADDVEIGKTV